MWLLSINNALAEMENVLSLRRIIVGLADVSCSEHVKALIYLTYYGRLIDNVMTNKYLPGK